MTVRSGRGWGRRGGMSRLSTGSEVAGRKQESSVMQQAVNTRQH